MGGAASIGREIRDDISKTMIAVMDLAADNVTNSTPVDTGHASSNWLLSFGAPSTIIAGSREAVDTGPQQAARANLFNYDVGRDGKIFLRNNVLYLQYLDRGWSQQAPPNFVAEAFTAAVRRAPYGRKGAARKMLRNMAKVAYLKGY